jgi:hypothetical protein
VTQILEVFHLPNQHRVAQVQIGCGRIEPDLDGQGPAGRQPLAEVIESDDVDASLCQPADLVLYGDHLR